MQTQILFNISLDNASIWPSSSNAWHGHLHKYLYMLEANHCASYTHSIYSNARASLYTTFTITSIPCIWCQPLIYHMTFNLSSITSSWCKQLYHIFQSSSYAIQLLRIFLNLGVWNPSCKPCECYRCLDSKLEYLTKLFNPICLSKLTIWVNLSRMVTGPNNKVISDQTSRDSNTKLWY
jgi:hypothetical protein